MTQCSYRMTSTLYTLFNALPITLRAKTDVSLKTFKASLDRFLRTLPDEPPMPHYHSRSSTNSIVDWLAIQRADGKFTYHEAATPRGGVAELLASSTSIKESRKESR
ncbi:hypothetical protein Pmani_004729 [Petrolisthes manimaculis]|uniref:Uncharacterized protein n=1 Tax=Petrolisthes manimaculis TaxID=1843537 RepID=A0AAE1UI95_9EUCA|nr:hypothetical protein Pmani_031111 [Petrolisthes manimaculis]KAK4324647.1 hypothetical protein Pmani_004729 [Petrolisthes manimaculis]